MYKPKVLLDYNILQKLKLYTKFAPGEISGLGTVRKMGNVLHVSEVYLFEQQCSLASTDLDRASMASFFNELMGKGVPTEQIKLWWHTHADFQTFWSHTDEAAIEGFDNETEHENWLLAMELNKAGDIIARVDIFSPLRVTIPNLKVMFMTNSVDLKKEIKEEVEAKVKVKSPGIWNHITKKYEPVEVKDLDYFTPPTDEEMDEMARAMDNEVAVEDYNEQSWEEKHDIK